MILASPWNKGKDILSQFVETQMYKTIQKDTQMEDCHMTKRTLVQMED